MSLEKIEEKRGKYLGMREAFLRSSFSVRELIIQLENIFDKLGLQKFPDGLYNTMETELMPENLGDSLKEEILEIIKSLLPSKELSKPSFEIMHASPDNEQQKEITSYEQYFFIYGDRETYSLGHWDANRNYTQTTLDPRNILHGLLIKRTCEIAERTEVIQKTTDSESALELAIKKVMDTRFALELARYIIRDDRPFDCQTSTQKTSAADIIREAANVFSGRTNDLTQGDDQNSFARYYPDQEYQNLPNSVLIKLAYGEIGDGKGDGGKHMGVYRGHDDFICIIDAIKDTSGKSEERNKPTNSTDVLNIAINLMASTQIILATAQRIKEEFKDMPVYLLIMQLDAVKIALQSFGTGASLAIDDIDANLLACKRDELHFYLQEKYPLDTQPNSSRFFSTPAPANAQKSLNLDDKIRELNEELVNFDFGR